MDKNELLLKTKAIPKRPGIYIYKNGLEVVVYVGKALSLRDRIRSYANQDVSTKTAEMLKNATTLEWVETGSDFEALLLEARLIKLYRPKYNITFKDDKSYLYIFVSTHEEYPKVFLTRRPNNFKSVGKKYEAYETFKGEYFGPFPSSTSARLVLKWLRRIFPFCTQKRTGNRACFYSHIGLCNPCPSFIIKQNETDKAVLKKKYRQNIFRLVAILHGNINTVIKDLTKEMRVYAKSEQFEEAAKCKTMIDHIEYILSNPPSTEVFLENPNFFTENQQSATEELQKILVENGLPVTKLSRIECFDISNFAGLDSVASQVVFVNGISEKGEYRRYKIKIDGKPNDFAMLSEAVSRRLKHTEWQLPDLLVIDGGKGQVSTIINTLKELKIEIPSIGLAKQFEKIVIFKNGEFTEVRLPKRSRALQLIQQMRDEAHRFGLAYHRKKRGVSFNQMV